MRKVFAFSLFVALATCPASAEDRRNPSPLLPEGGPGICFHPSMPLMLVANYEGSLSEALDESALTEEEQQEFLADFQATMAVKQAKLELLRVIHQLETVEKKCKGSPSADEAAQLLKLLPPRKDLQPGQSATATAARKKATVARRGRVGPAEATTVR